MLVQVPVVAAFLAPHPVDQYLVFAVRAVGAVAAAYARVLPGVPHGLTVRQAREGRERACGGAQTLEGGIGSQWPPAASTGSPAPAQPGRGNVRPARGDTGVSRYGISLKRPLDPAR